MSFPSWSNQANQPFRSSFSNQPAFGQTPSNPGFGSFGSQPGFGAQTSQAPQPVQPQPFGGFSSFNSAQNPQNPGWGSSGGFGSQPSSFGAPPSQGPGSNPFNNSGFAAPAQASNPFTQGGFSTGFMSQPATATPAAPSFQNTGFGGAQVTQPNNFNSGFSQAPSFGGGSLFGQNTNPSQPLNNSFSGNTTGFGAPGQGSLFSGGNFSAINNPAGGFGGQAPQGGIKYKPTSVREDTSNINVLHLCAMPEMLGKSIDEQRQADYKQRQSGMPQMPNPQSSNPLGFTTGTSPSLFNTGALTSQTSLFQKPSDPKPVNSLFPQTSGSSLFQNPSPSPSTFPTTSSPFTGNPTGGAALPTNQPSLFSSGSLFNPTPQASTSSSFFSNPQPSGSLFNQPGATSGSSLFGPKPAVQATPSFSTMNPMTGQQGTGFNGNQMNAPNDVFSSAFRDPHGLNWLFPEIIPESVLKNYKERYATQISAEPLSVVERLFKPKRVSNYPQILAEKWKNSQEKKSLKSSNSFDLLGNRKTEPFFVNKRTNFVNLKLEEYKDEDGNKYFKMPGSTARRTEQSFEITVKAHDPNPIKLVLQVTFDKTIREVLSEVSRHLPDIDQNSIQLLFKSNVLSPGDTIRSLGIVHNDELIVINTPIVHNSKQAFASEDLLPRIPEGYNTIPSYLEMARMSVEDLRKVENFTVFNKYGKVLFPGTTDVTGLDLGKSLQIVGNELTGYPGDPSDKPPVGRGLNKACEFTMFNIHISGPKERAEEKARNCCSRNHSEFMSYNQETGEFVVRLKHL